MDLIYTDGSKVDQGTLKSYGFDLAFGASENNFELVVGISEAVIDYDAILYIEGTEYGGRVDGKCSTTGIESITYRGRTFHGLLNSKVIEPRTGENYYIVSGDANNVISLILSVVGVSDMFYADGQSGINISSYQFKRYCKTYDGIKDMLAANGAKLKMEWVATEKKVRLSAVPIVDYTDDPVDGDVATLSVEHYPSNSKANHLICLGRGELSEREVIHLYADNNGKISGTKYYSGPNEVTETYENTNSENLEKDGISKFKELLNRDKADISLTERHDLIFDIGDIVGATDIKTGVSAAAAVSKKIVRISNGAISIEYEARG